MMLDSSTTCGNLTLLWHENDDDMYKFYKAWHSVISVLSAVYTKC